MPVVRRAFALLFACALLSACRVDATVDVDVAEDGSGTVAVTVTFDADAAARVPDLDGALRVEDLEAAGWVIDGPEEQSDGSVVVAATKPFASPEQLPVVLSEISSAFTDVQLTRSRSFGEVRWAFDGQVDFTHGAEQFGDEQLATLLGGRALGRDVATIEQETGTSVADATGLVLGVSLPGDAANEWAFRLDQVGATDVHLEGTIERSSAKLWAIVAAAAGVVLVVILLIGILRFGRNRGGRRRRREPLTPHVPTMDVDVPVAADASASRRLQLVVTAAHGVLWEDHARAEEWLASLASMQGAEPGIERVRALRREAMLGRLSTADFWRALGVAGDPAELDAAYAARFTLSPDVIDFVRLLARRGIGVACISGDTVEWSNLLRTRFGLERFVRPWVVSAEIGAMAPAPAPFEEVADRAAITMANCLYVDDTVENLDTAKQLGMATVLIGASSALARAHGHQHATDLRGLLTRRRAMDEAG
jgi:HAD superfamily hydrolase (TIGR01509 family)